MKFSQALAICLAGFSISLNAVADEPQAEAHDLLAACKDASQKPAFQITGDLAKLAKPRFQAQSASVAFADSANADFFGGDITLTKGAPYRFTLYGNQMNAERTRMIRWVYGWSQGTLLTIQDMREGQAIAQYTCVLNAELLTNP